MNFKKYYKLAELSSLLNKAIEKLRESFSLSGYSQSKLMVAHKSYNGNKLREAFDQEDVHGTIYIWRDKKFLSWVDGYKFERKACNIPKSSSGAYGTAFFSNSSTEQCDAKGRYVCKITKDSREASMSALIIEYKKNSGNSINVPHIDVVGFDDGKFAIMQNRVSIDVPKSIVEAAGFIKEYMEKFWETESGKMQKSFHTQPSHEDLVKNKEGQIVKQLNWNKSNPNAYQDDASSLRDELKDIHKYKEEIALLFRIIYHIFGVTGRWFADFHGANIGMSNGEPVFFDLGLNYEIIKKPFQIKTL